MEEPIDDAIDKLHEAVCILQTLADNDGTRLSISAKQLMLAHAAAALQAALTLQQIAEASA